MPHERGEVVFGAIALVGGESEPWIKLMAHGHDPIPCHLGDDRRRRDREASRIAVDQSDLR
jgi:hypothetical protein